MIRPFMHFMLAVLYMSGYELSRSTLDQSRNLMMYMACNTVYIPLILCSDQDHVCIYYIPVICLFLMTIATSEPCRLQSMSWHSRSWFVLAVIGFSGHWIKTCMWHKHQWSHFMLVNFFSCQHLHSSFCSCAACSGIDLSWSRRSFDVCCTLYTYVHI